MNKITLKAIAIASLAVLSCIPVSAQRRIKGGPVAVAPVPQPQVEAKTPITGESPYCLLDLDTPGLEKVKAACEAGESQLAAQALLDYYRGRKEIVLPGLDLQNITISATEQKWADESLDHTFFVHYGYQPSYNYGKDINWQYWPIKDNELRWQLHRHKWFEPLGKAFRTSGDEKYAREWTLQYLDWIAKNPLYEVSNEAFEQVSAGEVKDATENVRFAWRPLEVSHRIDSQVRQFALFLSSENFTPDFLLAFLNNYYKHVAYLQKHYTSHGNHLLFEAQRTFSAGVYFHEFKDAPQWRKTSVDILNREIKKQVFDDGGHFELDPHYHLAVINIFSSALEMAVPNGYKSDFPQQYIDVIRSMILFYSNICFPDHTNPCFSDAKTTYADVVLKDYWRWSQIFPGEELIYPDNLSKAHVNSGFFTFRNGWKEDATVMVVKAGPKGMWHCQPDNGTFDIWFRGKELFPDSGSYVYAGDKEVQAQRDWFRRSCSHNTLTLNSENFTTTESKTIYWNGEGKVQTLVTENPSYEGLTHRRTVHFVDEKFFVIVDEASGNAEGTVNLNFGLAPGGVKIDEKALRLESRYTDGSNVVLQCFAQQPCTLRQAEGWASHLYRSKEARTAVAFDCQKSKDQTIRYITVICPVEDASTPLSIKAKFLKGRRASKGTSVKLVVDGNKYYL